MPSDFYDRPSAQKQEPGQPRFRFEAEPAVMFAVVAETEIVVFKVELAGVGPGKRRDLAIPEEVFEVETSKWLQIVVENRAVATEFSQLVLQLTLKPGQQPVHDRWEFPPNGLVPGFSNLPCGLDPGIGAGTLERGIDQTEPGEPVQRWIDPAVERNSGRREGSQGGRNKAQDPEYKK